MDTDRAFIWGFQDQVAWRLTGRFPRRRLDGKWEYTSADAARTQAGFDPIETYIFQRQNTVAQYIATRSFMDLCDAAERKQGERVGIRW